MTPESRTSRLPEIARLFLKLGTTAFGGPAAHIAMMEEEVVRRRHWLTHQEFLDLLGATNLIPGPNSTEMAIHIGRLRAGWSGLLIAGTCFILPAALIVATFAFAYVRLGTLPETAGILYGVKPVVIVIVIRALWELGRAALKSVGLGVIALISLGLTLLGVNELLVLLGAGLMAAGGRVVGSGRGGKGRGALGLFAGTPAALVGGSGVTVGAAAVVAGAAPFTLGALFLVFAKVGALLFGSGYVLLAFLRADLVQRLGWLTESQLLDAVAIGQVTPGPVFTTATFIGYVLGGGMGAMVATAAIFLPAFLFVAVSGPWVPLLRRSVTLGGALDGVIAASLALLVGVVWHLGRAAIVDLPTAFMAMGSAMLAFRLRVNSAWLMLGGALAGLAWTMLRG